MKEINLRKFYPEIYKEDYIVTLPDEVVEVLMDAKRKETAHRIRTYRYKAYYSLDQGDNIEREMRHHVPSVQEIIEKNMEEEKLYAALARLPEKQRKRVYAYYILGIKQSDIAKMEGTSVSTVHESIRRGLRRLEKIMKKSL